MDQGAAERIRSSTIDGRAITPRFRQRQLAALQASLVKSRHEILSAITNDTKRTKSEAEAQYYIALQALKTLYLTLDPLKMIEEEYSLARSQSNPSKRGPYGCAYIVPSAESPFYSAVIPVAAAIAAGNCVVLELQQNLSELTSLLRKILPAALDRLTFAVVEEDVFDQDFKTRSCIVLDGRPKEDAVTTTRTIATPVSRVAAVVDRSANLQEAARECVRARFAFGGESAYAPDVVLVNEFKVSEFCSAVAEAALSYLTTNIDSHSNGSASPSQHVRQRAAGPSKELQQQLDDIAATVLASGSQGTVALLPS
jgi:acyl-CoA reductase-like NAD-dependent aldehyde dehydrogenase